jgi:hypothetical protein
MTTTTDWPDALEEYLSDGADGLGFITHPQLRVTPMNRPDSALFVQDFLNSPDTQRWVADALDYCARLSAAVAETHGFHEDEQNAEALLREGIGASAEYGDSDKYLQLPEWLRTQLLQAEIARIGEELGEAIDNIRHDCPPDDKCPQYPGWHVELGADVLIRVFDLLGKRGISPGEIFIAKTLVNNGRNWKHGKNS